MNHNCVEIKVQNIKITESLCFFAFLFFALGNSAAFALSPIGAPTSNLKKGQWNIGLDYSKTEIDLKIENIDGTTFFNKNKLKKVEIKNIMAKLSTGIYDNLEIFGGFGIAKAKYKETASWMDGSSLETAYDEHESDTGFAAEAGVKATFYRKGPLGLGALFLANWDTLDGTYTEMTWTDGAYNGYVAGDLDEDFLTIKVAPGASFKFDDNITLYGGPFWQWIDGMGHADVQTGLITSPDGNADIKQDSSFGGWIGLRTEIDDNSFLSIEIQTTSSSKTFGISLASKF